MAKNKKVAKAIQAEAVDQSYPYKDEDQLLNQVLQHYRWWVDDNHQRKTREGGWDDVTLAYHGKLPEDWPFISRTTDPRIRTTLLEKNARLTNRPLRGKVAPREDGDIVKARIQNALINYQWDAANLGGSMTSKIANADLDARMYSSKFGLVPWRLVENKDGKIVFEGNEFIPLNIEDCGLDPNSTGIKDAKWFQHRDYVSLVDLENNKSMYPGFNELKMSMKTDPEPRQTRRDVNYLNEVKTIKGLEDRMGTDKAFPVVEKVVEYRLDKTIVFCPKFNVILAIMDNVYDHGQIPVVQLRYYPTTGDNLGESEVEAVLPLWRAIQAVLCAFLDEVILKMRPPLKGVEGAFRMETIVYAPTAIWLMDNINALTEVETRSDSVRYFQTTYPALVGAFNSAMGDLSQGISNIDSTNPDKTATEIRQVAKQQNTRDQKNQMDLSEFVKDIAMMWMSNNRQFLFRDPKKKNHILKIVGQKNFEYFKRLGMDEMVMSNEGTQYIQELVQSLQEAGQEVSPEQIEAYAEAAKVPKYPVAMNPDAKNLKAMGIRPKMVTSEMGDSADLVLQEDDLNDGLYDFIPDTKSMEIGASEQAMFARTQAIQTVTNPNVLQLLQLEGKRPIISELLIANFEEQGLNDAERFFESATGAGNSQVQGGFNPTGGTLPTESAAGMANAPQAPSAKSIEQQMGGSNAIQNSGGLPGQL